MISYLLTPKRQEDCIISKDDVPALPNYFTRRFGLPLDIDHYNASLPDGRAIHVKDYKNKGYHMAHWDQVDPHKNPIGHLIVDAPKQWQEHY